MKKNNFSFDNKITSFDLIYICFLYSTRLIRGFIYHRKIIGRGKGCNIYKSSLGRGVNIGNNVILNGIGSGGLVIGDNVSIGDCSVFKVSGTFIDIGRFIHIGNNVGIGEFSHIGGAGGVKIGESTIIGPYFSVHPENHLFNDLNIPIRKQGVSQKGINIGSNCWIGAKVTILDGVTIGDGCVIAAGSIVTKSFPDNVVIGGVPSKILKKRNNEK
ncbi:acyltransferase [Photobacterium damselae subsp. damselae]|uniref:Acyltransferase n=2 Tax=Photobacterium damselae TaxID=38293 RepID=A0AAD3X0G0_PHODD|nr:acyltransferase [Photobacterium damselae subsp. damselae]